MASRSKPQQYDEKNIKRLKGLAHVRFRPGMYLGERGDFMVFQGKKEVIDNCYDEFVAGRNKTIMVYADNKTGTYIVADKAMGIPVGLQPADPKKPKGPKVSTLTLIFTELGTGGKFDDKAYKTSKGTHGVGAAATNAVSESFEVWTKRDGNWHYQQFKKGEPVAPLAKVTGVPKAVTKLLKDENGLEYKPRCGSIVKFTPDQSIVSVDGGKTKAKLDLAFTANWLKSMAMLNPGLAITFTANGKSKTYLNKGSIATLLKSRLEALEAEPLGKPFVLELDTITLAMQWSSYSEDDGLKTYVSSGETDAGGEHELGLRGAITKAVAAYKKKNEKYAPTDLYSGLVGYLDFKMSGAEYSGQTKNKLTSKVAAEVESLILPELTKFFGKNKALARKVIKRAMDVKKSKEEFKKSLESIADAKARSKGISLPGVLVSSPKASPHTRELYLVEGDSAMGTAKYARDDKYQEVMKMNGKIANAMRTKLNKLLGSPAVQNILASMGYNFDAHRKDGIDPTAKLRINKLFLLPDADEDGNHIAVLVLTLVYRLMPKLIEEGRVYVVDAPLYSAYHNNKRYFGDDFKSVQKQLPKGCKAPIMRAKGWGEIGREALEHIAFNPKTRQVIQVQPIKGKEAKYFEMLVGKDTEARKRLLGI